jgi:hypothetical protein
MFFYGKEEFDTFYLQMVEVVNRMGFDSSMPEQFWMSYESREESWLTQNEVTKFVSQGYVSQSAMTIKTFKPFPKGGWLLPVRVKSFEKKMDPCMEELLASVPIELPIVATNYYFGNCEGDVLIVAGKWQHPIVFCLELKSNRKIGAALRQAAHLSSIVPGWLAPYDPRNPQQYSLSDAYAVAFTPFGCKHNYTYSGVGPNYEEFLHTWYARFITELGLSGFYKERNIDTPPVNN